MASRSGSSVETGSAYCAAWIARYRVASQESKIDEVVNCADKNFKSNAYMTSASLVSLHYRIGTMALGANRCERVVGHGGRPG